MKKEYKTLLLLGLFYVSEFIIYQYLLSNNKGVIKFDQFSYLILSIITVLPLLSVVNEVNLGFIKLKKEISAFKEEVALKLNILQNSININQNTIINNNIGASDKTFTDKMLSKKEIKKISSK